MKCIYMPRAMHGAAALMVAASLVGCGGGSGSSPAPATYRVGGSVYGLQTGPQDRLEIRLSLNGVAQTLSVSDSFAFDTRLVTGSSYDVGLLQNPANHLCTLSQGSGQVGSTDVTSIRLDCSRTFLNDTGIVTAQAGQPAGQDPDSGRDKVAADGLLRKIGSGPKGFDFTKVCLDGQAEGAAGCTSPTMPSGVSTEPGQWTCTRDNVTGLIWLVNPSNNPRYDTGTGSLGEPPVASPCGRSDWTLPDAVELASIVDAATPAGIPSATQANFPALSAQKYWVSDAAPAGQAWFVHFGEQGAIGREAETAQNFFMLVSRGSGTGAAALSANTLAAANRFTVASAAGGGTTVTDVATGLMWWIPPASDYTDLTWSQALQAAPASAAGRGNWRLPNLKELASLVNRAASGGALVFGTTPAMPIASQSHWTSSPSGTSAAWTVNFATGEVVDVPLGVAPLRAIYVRDLNR